MQGHSLPPELDPVEYELALEKEDALYRARNGLLNFTKYTKPNYSVQWYHRALCKKLNAFADGKIKRLMVFMPPRHGKSELVSRRLPAYIFGRNPDAQIIACSYASDLAFRMNRDVQRIIDDPKYGELFPSTTLNNSNVRTVADGSYLRNSDLFEIVGHGGVYRAAGVGGGITGMGGNYLIIDDPIKDQEQADSEVYREKVYDWYASTLYTRAEGDAGILITLTRWHEGDLAGRLLAQAATDPEADQWEVFNLPALRESDANPLDEREIDEALWPEKFPAERLKRMRATMGSRKFNALYQQRPSAEDGETIKRAWTLNRYKTLPTFPEKHSQFKGHPWDELVLSADLRFKEDKKSGDYVVIQAWGRLGARIYFLGEERGRWGFTDSLISFARMSDGTPIGKFRALRKLVENKANGPALENVLKNKIPGIVLVEPDGSKRARVESITPLWEAGNVWLPDASIYPQIDEIVSEWTSFGPGCAFDDRTDAMSQALRGFTISLDNYLEALVKL